MLSLDSSAFLREVEASSSAQVRRGRGWGRGGGTLQERAEAQVGLEMEECH